MRKAKVAAIVCGMIASCLFGGFAVVEAATITLDDSSADLVVYVQPTTEDYEPEEAAIAVTVTSIETTATAESRTTTVNYAGVNTAKDNTKNETPTAVTTAKAEKKVETTTTAATVIETPITTEADARAPKESAARSTTTTAATTAATTTTTAATTVKVEIVPLEAEINTPGMPAEQAAPAAQPAAVEQAIEIAPASVTPEIVEVPAEVPVIAVEQIIVDEYPAFEMSDPTMLETPDVQPYEAPTESAPVQPDSNSVSVSDSDYILLCNAVAHEAGANNISVEEKAKVVEVIMNRVNSSKYPDSVYGVLTQKYQFSGSSSYVDLGSFSGKVTDQVKEAVDMYLSDPTQFSHGYLSFYGDGSRNHFS